MKNYIKILLGIGCAFAVVALSVWYLRQYPIDVLQPAGEIGSKQRDLIIVCSLLSVTVVIPVFWLLFHFAWKYRAGNKKAKYDPEQHGSNALEAVWWLVPTALMIVISVITWRSSFALDPYKPLESNKKTLHVQVVSMDWKWLFIYPDQKVASVNEVAIPVGTPVKFEITSDSVMSSFWVPKLGGQMYAMPGMTNKLHLNATKVGDYRGVTANISGAGFAGMDFTVKAMGDADYSKWLAKAKDVHRTLDSSSYAVLAKPATQKKPSYYSAVTPDMFNSIVMKYMMPTETEGHAHSDTHEHTHEGDSH